MTSNDRNVFESTLRGEIASLKVELSDRQIETLWRFRSLVIEANKRFNLTRITEPRDFATRHVADSLAILSWLGTTNAIVHSVLDIGSGAGIPAIPLAIATPKWRITAIDGTGKKVGFIHSCADALGLTNLKSLHKRAESWTSPTPFDLVTMKAVGPIDQCLRYARPHVSSSGTVVMFKGEQVPSDEIDAGRRVTCKLGFGQAAVFRYVVDTKKPLALNRTLWIYRPLNRD